MSELMFSVKSRSSDRELVFLEPRRDYFVVELRGLAVSARREVYAFPDPAGIAARAETFFRVVAND